MFPSIQQKTKADNAIVAIDVAPLIDIVFILLIFFMVSSTFITDTGIGVEKAQATFGQILDSRSLRISIAASGTVYAQGRQLDDVALDQLLRQTLRSEPQTAVIIIPDRRVTAQKLVEVMDRAKLAGVQDLAIATARE